MILTKSWLGYDLPVDVIEAHPAVQTLRGQGIEKHGKREYHLLVAYFESIEPEVLAALVAETEAQLGAPLTETTINFDGYGMIEGAAGTYAYFAPSVGGATAAAALKARVAASLSYDALKNCRDLHVTIGGVDPLALDKPKRGPLKQPFEIRGRLALVGFDGDAYKTFFWNSASRAFVEDKPAEPKLTIQETKVVVELPKPAIEAPKPVVAVSQPAVLTTSTLAIEPPKLPVQQVVRIEEKKITLEEQPPIIEEKKLTTPPSEPKSVESKLAPVPAASSPVASGMSSSKADAVVAAPKPVPAAPIPIKTLLLPVKVMPDVACATYLLRAYGAKLFPGAAEAELSFANELPAGKTPDALAKEGTLVVDRRTEFASGYFAKVLGVAERPELRKLLAYAKRDFERKSTLSTDPLDKMFSLAGIAMAMNRVYSDDPRAVLEFLISVFEAIVFDESKKPA